MNIYKQSKNLKRFGFMVLFLFSITCINAQLYTMPSTPWDTIHIAQDSLTFSLPTSPIVYDTLHVEMYASIVDSLLGLEVHIVDSIMIHTSQPIVDSALSQTGNDTMAAIAKIFLLATNSTTVEYIDTTINQRRSITIGLAYQTLASNTPYYTFIDFFLLQGKFYAFSITGSVYDLTRLTAYKNVFFNSINFQ